MVIAVLIGAAVGGARRMYPPDPLAEYGGNTINGQRNFEIGLLQDQAGMRHFKELVVFPPADVAGKKKHIIAGKFYNGRPQRNDKGQVVANFRPSCYVHEETAYTPLLDLSRYNKPGGVDYVKKWQAIKNPTIVDFLKLMQEVDGLQFKMAWYKEPNKAIALWIAGCFVGIGLIWPSIIYLIAFGSIFEPPREASIDVSALRGVNTSTTAASKPQVSQAEIDRVKQMGDELEAKLKADADERGAVAPPPPKAAEGPVRQLRATKSDASQVEEQKDDRTFGADADDFYPTERKVHHDKPG
jgi:hypothetical protein